MPRRLRFVLTLSAGAFSVLALAFAAAADTTPSGLPFAQDWTNTGLITTSDDWSGVPSVVGYRGDNLTPGPGGDPQTVLGEGIPVVDVNANQTTPNTFATGGVSEFEITNAVVALQGSGTADAPSLVLTVNTTGASSVNVSYLLRDVDGGSDNSIQPVALQYRVGSTGDFTNVPAGYVSDATTGPNLATLTTSVNVGLPAEAAGQPTVQIRIITADAVGTDEWVGVDDIVVAVGDAAPAVQSTTPTNGGTDVPVSSNFSVTFTEPVNAAASSFTISCATSGSHAAVLSDGPTTFTLDPTVDFTANESCTVTVLAASVTDQDSIDPPDNMAADFVFSFTTVAPASAIKISEVYGGGGNAGATYTNDFIELYNPTASAAGLTGWSVQYASSTGSTWAVTPLAGSIAAGRNYLVQEAAGTGGTTPLPSPDATGTIPMSGTAGKVALVSTTTPLSGTCPTSAAIVDLVGYGAANCSEIAPTAALSNTTSAQRKAGGAQDTGNNSNDFDIAAPDPHAGADQAPSVASSTPASGATGVARDANVSITFSEPVNISGDWYTIDCSTSGPHAAAFSRRSNNVHARPSLDFSRGETCTVTWSLTKVTDTDGDDPPNQMAANHVFTFQTASVSLCGELRDGDLRDPGQRERCGDHGNVTVEGVVVGDFEGVAGLQGFYLQDAAGDGDAAHLRRHLRLHRRRGHGQRWTGRPRHRLRPRALQPDGAERLEQQHRARDGDHRLRHGSVSPTDVSMPFAAMDSPERYEGMLVRFPQSLVISEYFNYERFGELVLGLPLAG